MPWSFPPSPDRTGAVREPASTGVAMPRVKALVVALSLLPSPLLLHAAGQPHNVILFVPDGLRAVMVDKTTAPAMTEVRDSGVNFQNSHSLFPTVMTANASALAT